jgi:hypothetical protein
MHVKKGKTLPGCKGSKIPSEGKREEITRREGIAYVRRTTEAKGHVSDTSRGIRLSFAF